MLDTSEVRSSLVEAQRLSATGIGQFELQPASLQAVKSLHSMFERLDMNEVFDCLEGSVLTVSTGETEAHTLAVCHSQSTRTMRWLWAADSETLSLFGSMITPEVQEQLSQSAGGAVEVNAACYIIVRNGVMDEECKPHYDFFSPHLPRAAAFSLMTPMSVAHPTCVGGLEYWPWSGPDRAVKDSETAFRTDARTLPLKVLAHHHGLATIIDGRILHRTRPYGHGAFSGAPLGPLTEAIASGDLRVLLCVNASRTTSESWPHLERLLQRQVGFGFVRCNTVFHKKQDEADLGEAGLAPVKKKKGGFLLRNLMK